MSHVSQCLSSSESDDGLDRSFTNAFMSEKTKIFNDTIHGTHTKLPSLCYRIINTPQFQRLRNLKQVGLCYHVYPSASHNRFEHCIGTSYLAGKYCRILQKNQPTLEINDEDILCLYIAGLCHDLGHGPFSHTWEHFMKHYKPDYTHEEMSIRMLDSMIDDNGLWEWFVEDNLQDIDRVFIKELILGHPLSGCNSFKGRGPEKNFLYQIVSNDETKIDVDKFDYLLRDCKQLNLPTTFDHQRVFDNSRVFMVKETEDGPEVGKIAYRKKISENLMDLFDSRFRMHKTAYQHRVTKIIEEMVLDALIAAEPDLRIYAKDKKVYRLSTAHEDLSAFIKLTDAIFDRILWWSGDDNINPKAAKILTNILCRDLYKSLGYLDNSPQDDVLKEFEAISSNLTLIKTSINYGLGSENPLSRALFYEKSHLNRCFKIDVQPAKTEKHCYIVYKNVTQDSFSITPDVELREVQKQLKAWAARHHIQIHFE